VLPPCRWYCLGVWFLPMLFRSLLLDCDIIGSSFLLLLFVPLSWHWGGGTSAVSASVSAFLWCVVRSLMMVYRSSGCPHCFCPCVRFCLLCVLHDFSWLWCFHSVCGWCPSCVDMSFRWPPWFHSAVAWA